MEPGYDKLIIYTPEYSPRLHYIGSIIIEKLLGLKFEMTSDVGYFEKSGEPKICYAHKEIFPNCLYLKAHPIIYETNIQHRDPEVFEIEGSKAFFGTDTSSFFPFDIFASSFFLITRYEEYFQHVTDKHGRFNATNSLAYRKGFLEEPIIHNWAALFKIRLSYHYPKIIGNNQAFSFLSTMDIDNAWAHLNKGFLRTFISFALLLVRFDFKNLVLKTRVLLKNETDPYDNYDYIEKIHKKYKLIPLTFILFSDYTRYDKNPSVLNKKFRKLVKQISRYSDMGMHPSYHSNKNSKILLNEKKALENLVGRRIEDSRQHYLMLKMPETYINLIKLGIKRDFSMGYSSHAGFRAGICIPFPFFNLKTNEVTSLEIVPFSFMDVYFTEYLKVDPETALKSIQKLVTSVKKVNGLFVSLWHNETLRDTDQSYNWRWAFEQMIIRAHERN